MSVQRDVNPENDKELNKMLDAKFGKTGKLMVKGSTARVLGTLLKRAASVRKQFEDRIFDPRREAETQKEVQEPADHVTLPGRDKTNPAYKRVAKGKITHTQAYNRVKDKPGVRTPHALAQHIVEQAGGEPKKKVNKRVVGKHAQHDQSTHGRRGGGAASRAPSKVRVRIAGHKLREAGEAISPRATEAAGRKLREKLNPKVLIRQIDSVLDDIDAGGRIARRLREIKSDLNELFRAAFPPKEEKVTKAMLNDALEKGIRHSLELLTNALNFIGDQDADSKISAADDKKLGNLIDDINGMVGYLKDVKEQGFFEKIQKHPGDHDQSVHAPKGQRSMTSTDPIPSPPNVPKESRRPYVAPKDVKDATGAKPGEFREMGGSVYMATVMPMKIPGTKDDYETKLRWHRASGKDARRYIRERKQKVSKRTVGKHGSHDQSTHGKPKGSAKDLPNVTSGSLAAERATSEGDYDMPGVKPMRSTRVKQSANYDFYQLDHKGERYYNIVPRGSKAPAGGYKSKTYIERIKHEQFNSTDEKVSKGEPAVPDSSTTYRPSYTTPAVARELKRQGIKPNAKGRGTSTARAPGY